MIWSSTMCGSSDWITNRRLCSHGVQAGEKPLTLDRIVNVGEMEAVNYLPAAALRSAPLQIPRSGPSNFPSRPNAGNRCRDSVACGEGALALPMRTVPLSAVSEAWGGEYLAGAACACSFCCGGKMSMRGLISSSRGAHLIERGLEQCLSDAKIMTIRIDLYIDIVSRGASSVQTTGQRSSKSVQPNRCRYCASSRLAQS